ncbi:MAG: histidine kinase [Bacteroidota bacterium]
MRSLLFLALVLASFGEAVAQDVAEGRFRLGDDARWADPEWDDGDWERRPLLDAPDTTGVLWVRIDLTIGDLDAPGLLVSAAAAREVYWDGVRIGAAGRVGADRASEVPGPIDAVFSIPDSLAASGPHVVAIRFSTFHRPASVEGLLLRVTPFDLRAASTALYVPAVVPLLFLGGFLLVALYYGALFVADHRRTPYLLTSLLCLAVAALLVAERWRMVLGYPYDLHGVRLATIDGLTWTVGILLVGTLAIQFAVPRARTALAGVAAASGTALLAVPDHEAGAFVAFALALVAALGVTAWAVARMRPGARWALGGVLVCLAALGLAGRDFMDSAFFPAFGVLLGGLLVSLGLQTRDQRRRHEAALAEAARLEAELLKKHLQPHFLMNALTSVIEWVERDPAQGVQALEALADELRMLAEVSGERCIPMRRELALCRTHLDVMSFRHGVQFALDADVDPEAALPPAVLHTLVENAVTHNAYPPGPVTFTLREERADGRRRLTLRTPLAGAPAVAGPEGGGLRYVRARLGEVAPDRARLASGAEDGAWVTRIDLPTEADLCAS